MRLDKFKKNDFNNLAILLESSAKNISNNKNLFVCVLGETRSGKSTFINYLLGRKLKINQKKFILELASNHGKGPVIGHGKSMTDRVELFESDKLSLCDTPGLNDTNGGYRRLAAALGLGLVTSSDYLSSVVLMLTPDAFDDSRTFKLFHDIEYLLKSIYGYSTQEKVNNFVKDKGRFNFCVKLHKFAEQNFMKNNISNGELEGKMQNYLNREGVRNSLELTAEHVKVICKYVEESLILFKYSYFSADQQENQLRNDLMMKFQSLPAMPPNGLLRFELNSEDIDLAKYISRNYMSKLLKSMENKSRLEKEYNSAIDELALAGKKLLILHQDYKIRIKEVEDGMKQCDVARTDEMIQGVKAEIDKIDSKIKLVKETAPLHKVELTQCEKLSQQRCEKIILLKKEISSLIAKKKKLTNEGGQLAKKESEKSRFIEGCKAYMIFSNVDIISCFMLQVNINQLNNIRRERESIGIKIKAVERELTSNQDSLTTEKGLLAITDGRIEKMMAAQDSQLRSMTEIINRLNTKRKQNSSQLLMYTKKKAALLDKEKELTTSRDKYKDEYQCQIEPINSDVEKLQKNVASITSEIDECKEKFKHNEPIYRQIYNLLFAELSDINTDDECQKFMGKYKEMVESQSVDARAQGQKSKSNNVNSVFQHPIVREDLNVLQRKKNGQVVGSASLS